MSWWNTWLAEPLSSEFMVRALIATVALSVAAPLAGVWIVSRRMVYLADAMSHSMLAGVAGAAILGGSLLVGGLVSALVLALAVSWLVTKARATEDGAIGVAGQALFALGIIGVSYQQDPRALSHVLFGNPLTVTWRDVAVDVVLASLVIVGLVLAKPLLIATTFDPQHARTVGIRVGVVDVLLLTALAVIVVVGLVTVGVLMAITLTVAPAVAARMASDRLDIVLLVSAVLGLVAGIGGLFVSYHASLPTGPAVALAATLTVVGAYFFRRLRRGLSRAASRHTHSETMVRS